MKLEFRGHDDRYAIEQSLLAFFPEERPVYGPIAPEDDDCALVSLTEGKRYATGVTTLYYHGKTARGVSRAVLTDAPDEYERERLRQRALKLSFFKAARDITGITPSWGALTGIRPGKLARAMLEQGKTERETDRVLRDTYFVSLERRRLAIETAQAVLAGAGVPCEAATDADWRTEYLDLTISVRTVGSLEEAIAHINRYGSHHTDGILTQDDAAAQRFFALVDSAGVYQNCSTRFADGYRYGFGAEVGIATGKLHARGPMGVEGLCSYKYILRGHGDVVTDFAGGRRSFTHKRLI